ncbi:MAG: PAS domain-containing protein [Pseudomonadales bacterium]|jgi:two-component system sensor histidine kinase FlrB|nr:PAS domain-containing protein [Gammaproteobacteria bacterium]MBP6052761.1 PAS domain-containing protein [Pseudomonadales bacterium]MBK7168644.1 PAS domain-containing protein [Gammaproteobacteria bacterium]MBK8308734.1 PAS domain-containing protein [Gammaproteobacteria bacterium]MBK9667155.1 PAS domain-containing protein [Gammaproteobacteria bacterium]
MSAPARAPAIRDSNELQAAFAQFNRVSGELTDSYRLLEQRVEQLSTELDQVDRARLRELEERERLSQRLRSLLDLLPGGVVVLDPQGVICDCNPAAREMLQVELAGQRWVDVIRRAFAPRPDDGHEISLASGRRVSVATRSLDRDWGQVVLLTDQTETRELQDRLSRHQRLTAMGRMMAALAHQIRTPLAAAMLYAANLCEADLPPEQTRKFSARILARLSHMEQQVRDMLVFVRGDAQPTQAVTIEELVRGIEAALEAPLAAAQARCEWRLGCDTTLVLQGNREALIGAVLNLVNNGLEAGGRGCVLGLAIERREQQIVITVGDDGPGMSELLLARIEEEFFTTKAQGTGLGLAVVRSVARAHGGRLELQSRPGQGTRASVVLPLLRNAGVTEASVHG